MVNNDYLSCNAYKNQKLDPNNEGFVTFFDTTTKSYFFALTEPKTDTVLFRSEAYPTEAARKTGINAVIKNKSEVKRYSIIEEEAAFLVILKAGNHKEIARSCPFANAEEAKAFIEAVSTGVTFEKATVAPKATKEIAQESTAKVAPTVAPKAATSQESAVKVTPTVAPQSTATPKAAAKKTVAQTLALAPTETYLGHDTLTDEYGKTGFALFTADQKHYFAVYNGDGSIFQASAGFDSVEVRDTIFSTMKNVITNENAYQVVKENEKYAVVIKDEKDAILSRSLDFDSFTEAHLRTPAGWYQPTEIVGTMY
jgi:uncharacterized protein YegP (UPF0339 family)